MSSTPEVSALRSTVAVIRERLASVLTGRPEAIELLLIGVLLVVEAWDKHLVEANRLRAFVYFAMGFSTVVELLNLRVRQRATPVALHNSALPPEDSGKDA